MFFVVENMYVVVLFVVGDEIQCYEVFCVLLVQKNLVTNEYFFIHVTKKIFFLVDCYLL